MVKVSDLIKRDDVINMLRSKRVDKPQIKYNAIWNYELGKVEREVKNLPPGDRPEGYWHWAGNSVAGYATIRCSNCGDAFLENSGKWNYCPTCGADMREMEEYEYVPVSPEESPSTLDWAYLRGLNKPNLWRMP